MSRKIYIFGGISLVLSLLIYPPQIGLSKHIPEVEVKEDTAKIQQLIDSAESKKENIIQDLNHLEKPKTKKTVIRYKVQHKDRKIKIRYRGEEFEVTPNIDKNGDYILDFDILEEQTQEVQK